MEEARVTDSLGLLDTQEMWQGVAGEKQEAAQGAHTFTLPPDQEVAMLLDQPPIISFQQPVKLLANLKPSQGLLMHLTMCRSSSAMSPLCTPAPCCQTR